MVLRTQPSKYKVVVDKKNEDTSQVSHVQGYVTMI